MAEIKVGGVRFEEAARYIAQKIRLPSTAWTDLREGQHARGFVVAGATKDELLKDLQAAIQAAIDDGTDLRKFREDFEAIVAKHGWTGWTGEGSKAGRAWRAGVIYSTNISMARAAGRWEQIQRVKKDRPWIRYVAVLDSRTRPDHRRWHGTVLPVDHPWWDTHFPPCDWGCRCTIQSLSTAQMTDFGYKPSDEPPPFEPVTRRDPFTGGQITLDRGIAPGFNYNPGKAHVGLIRDVPARYAQTADRWTPLEGGAYRLLSSSDYGAAPLEPRTGAKLGPPAGNLQEMHDRVKSAIGGEFATFTTPDGMAVEVDARVLAEHLVENGVSRAPFIPLLPLLLEAPQEVWLVFEENQATGKVELRRRHIGLFKLPGKDQFALAVLQAARGIFETWTLVPVRRSSYIERQRRGVRIWPATDRADG